MSVKRARALWKTMSGQGGASVQRQAPLLGYFPDFLCLSRRLLVEIDGPHHEAWIRRLMTKIATKFPSFRLPNLALHNP
jgi:very-short-patch-repair endonuclease